MQKASALANKFASNLQGKINTGMVDPAKKAKFEFKDVSRIVQGIIVSKIFYSSLNAIRRATDAVWEFSKELEYAKMVYSTLFGDTDLAQEFINVLKDFAAVTPFSFKQSEEAAKRLLAYGIESKNVMFMMQGVLSAATVQGTDAIIEPISRAMGQIYTKGRLMNEEMRQLAESGIPVYEILQEKLHLTEEELRNLGRTAIPASTALNALVEGINERFGTTMQAASSTTQGIISNIVDNSTMLFAGIFEPFTEYLRGALGRFGEFINELRSIYELKGIGGVFEKLIPPALQQDIKVLIANLKILWDIIKSTLASAFRILGSLLRGLLYAFNALAPAIHTVVGTLAGLLKVITSNEKLMKGLTTAILAAAAAWVVYKIQAVAASIATVVIKGIVGAIKALVTAMNFVVSHPLWALLALGVGIFIALTGASDKFRDSINKLFGGFTKLSSMDPNEMLLPDSKDRASDLDKFNEALSDTSKSIDDVAEAAAKAGKNIMSFDEVFTIDQSKDNEDVIPDIPDVFKGFEMPDIDMELPDVGGIATDFVDNLIEALGGKDKLLGTGIGSLLGGAIGMVVGGPAGAIIGAAIGAFVGWLVGLIVDNWGPITDWFKQAWTDIKDWFKQAWTDITDWLAQAIADIGEFFVGIGEWFVQAGKDIAEFFVGIGEWLAQAWTDISDWLAQAWTDITDWLAQAISNIGEFFVGIGKWFVQAGKDIGEFFAGIGEWLAQAWTDITTWFTDLLNTIGEFFVNIWETITEKLRGAWKSVKEFFQKIWDTITEKLSGAWDSVKEFFQKIWESIVEKLTNAWDSVKEFFQKIWDSIVEKLTNAWDSVKEFFQNIWDTITEKLSGAWASVKEFFQKIWDSIVEKLTNTWDSVSEFFQKMWDTITEKLGGAWSSVTEFFSDMYNTVRDKIADMYESVKTGIGDIYQSFKNWVSDMWDNIFGKFFGWIDNAIGKLKDFFGLNDKAKTTDFSYTNTDEPIGKVTKGHAVGGVFNREHIARFAEGNKAEAIIPLENEEAMRPFVNAVSDGLTSALMPMLVSIANQNQNQNQLRPLYVGTLIADERALKELERKLQVIRISEDQRRG